MPADLAVEHFAEDFVAFRFVRSKHGPNKTRGGVLKNYKGKPRLEGDRFSRGTLKSGVLIPGGWT
jgi:hypothetical protein